MFAYAHPAMLRRVIFGIREGLCKTIMHRPMAPSSDAFPEGTIFLPQICSAGDVPKADVFLREHLGNLGLLADSPVGGVVKMVIAEARNFPELARIWHDRLIVPALGAMTMAIAAGQARGEIRPGDPRHYAVSLISPMLVGVIWRETFTPVGAEPFDLPALAEQHVETLLRGMLEPTQ